VATALGVPAKRVLPASTGVIGVLLPDQRIVDATPELIASLAPDGAEGFAQAICTTDRWPKTASATFTIGRHRATVLGIAKGAGMIHPNMATTLGFVVLDAPVKSAALKRALRAAVEDSFNRMSVDGDTSTNDAIVVLASGALGGKTIDGQGLGARKLRGVLTDVLESLGEQIVADGEGAERLVRIEVEGASDESAALRVARTIATSQLVKTAIHGCDPNWGRIVAAAGRSGVRFDPSVARVDIGDVRVFERGVPVMDAATEKRAAAVMKTPRYGIRVGIGTGRGRAWYVTCDLGHEYVRINADYRS
jgi:glutamate N-acetyltransferase/amino-acid N-acetyltransferase